MDKRIGIFVLVATLVFLASACVGDETATDRAKADRIRQETANEAASRAASEARSQADWESTRAATNLAKQAFLLLLAVTVAVALLFALAIVLVRLWQVSRSIVTYAETRAALKAGAIHVDRQTLTWPTLVNGDAIHNLQTGEVYRLTEPKPADSQQVTGDVFIRALGAGTQGAVKIGKSVKEGSGAADAIGAMSGALPLVLGGARSGAEQRSPARNGARAETNRQD